MFSVRANSFEAIHIFVNLQLELVDLVERAFSQERKVARVLAKNVPAQRIKPVVKRFDLFDSLLQVAVGLYHSRSESEVLPDELLWRDGQGLVSGADELTKMLIGGDDVVGLSGNRAVNKLVIIAVGCNDAKAELRMLKKNIGVQIE